MPVPVARGRPAAEYPHEWAIFEWLPGRNPTPGVVPDSLAEELAGFIAALHAVDLAGGPDSVRGSDLARFDEFTRANLKALEGELDTATAETLMVAWNVLDTRGRAVFREAAGYDDAAWARGRGWALWGGLGGIPYYRETFPEFASNARRTVDEVMAEAV